MCQKVVGGKRGCVCVCAFVSAGAPGYLTTLSKPPKCEMTSRTSKTVWVLCFF